MTFAAEDDVQAEQQIHASFRRVADQAAPSLESKTREEQTPALSDPVRQIECGATHISVPRTSLSPKLPVYCSTKSLEQTTALKLKDDFLSTTGNQSGIDFGPVPEKEADDNVGDFSERNNLISPHHPLTVKQETRPEASSGVSIEEWETRQHTDQDINMEDVSSSSPKLPWIKAEIAWTSTPVLPKESSIVTNPWPMFASPAILNRFPKPTSSSDFPFGNQSSSSMTTSQRTAEKFGGFQACPTWFNGDVAQCQRSGILKLPGNRVEPLAVHESADDTSRFLQKLNTSSSEVAGETISCPDERDLNAHDDKRNGFVNDFRPRRLAMIPGQDKSPQMKWLSESQHETRMIPKPKATVREANTPSRERGLIVHGDKQNDFFGGLHPSRMTLISEREPSPSEQMLSQSTWKPTGANLIQRGLVQDIVEIPKGPKNKEHVQKIETGICSSKRSSTKYWSKDETQFVIEGIESLKKRHTLLDQSFPLGKPWFFALQEIAAILRTPFVYDYSPHISDRNGHTIQLKTDFKVFRLREPLSKKQGKELITKKAVLYVIGGPFFFKQATPALNGR
jgi:hypothetical protein